MSTVDVLDTARRLREARRSGVPIEPLTAQDPDLDESGAYAIQEALVDLMTDDGDTPVGYKLGLTSRAMQSLLGVDSPDFGLVMASMVCADTEALDLRRLIAPRIEAEIAVVLATPLRGPNVTVEDVRAAVGGVSAALEVVDSRIADWRITLADTVADLASCGAVKISPHVVPLDDLDLRLVGMVLTRNEEMVDTGAGAASLGDPLAAVAWLANRLGSLGRPLEAGRFVMTGALHAAVPIAPGDVFHAEFDRIGAVTLTVADTAPAGQERS